MPLRPPRLQGLRGRLRLIRWLYREGRLVDRRHAVAFLRVPRHLFVQPEHRAQAYEPGALPAAAGQTVSQADMVALMTGLLQIRPGDRVLEVGTGTGYQAAILAAMGARVTSIEIRPELHQTARRTLSEAGLSGIDLRLGDGSLGAPDAAPFRGIVLGCVPETLPPALIDQLAPGGRLVGPEGRSDRLQTLVVLRRTPTGVTREEIRGAWFVPLVHQA